MITEDRSWNVMMQMTVAGIEVPVLTQLTKEVKGSN